MLFCATSRRLGAETLYPNLTISDPPENGDVKHNGRALCEQYRSDNVSAEDHYRFLRGTPIVGSHYNESRYCYSDRRLPRHWRGIGRNRPSLSPPDPVSIAVMGFGIVLAAHFPFVFWGIPRTTRWFPTKDLRPEWTAFGPCRLRGLLDRKVIVDGGAHAGGSPRDPVSSTATLGQASVTENW